MRNWSEGMNMRMSQAAVADLAVRKGGRHTKNCEPSIMHSVTGGLMMAADASAFDITTAMAGFLGKAAPLAADSPL